MMESPTCVEPINLLASNLTSSSAELSWTATGSAATSNIEYGLAGFSQGTGTLVNGVTTNPYTLTGLNPNTVYSFYVQSDCGVTDGLSIWSGPYVFKTPCAEVTAFVENFDTSPTGTGNLPSCWSKVGTSNNVYTTTGSLAPMSPTNRLYMNISATTTAFAVMPPVSNLQANTHRLKFKVYCTTANKVISVGYFTTPGDATTYVEIEPFQMPSTVVANTQEFTVVPTTVPAGVNQLVFNLVAGAATTAYIDDVKWEVNSSCVEPSALTATSITNTSATLGWTNGGPETIWDIQYGLVGFSLGSGTMINGVTVNPHVLSGLTANTQYEFYVRGICTGPENSSWSGPFLFKTQCDDVTEFTENFEGYATGTANPLPDCWGELNIGTGNSYITTGSNAPMSSVNRLYMTASGTVPTETCAVLPSVSNLQANTHRLKFKAYSSSGTDRFLAVGYLTDPSDLATFVQLEEVNIPGTTLASTQDLIVVPGVLPAGVKNLAIKNAGHPSGTTIAYIDDVSWELIPTIAPSCATNLIAVPDASCGNFATSISWDVTPIADGYKLTIGTTTGGNDVLDNEDLGSYTSYSFSGFANTTYYYTLVPYNTFGNAVGCTEQTFTTAVNGCTCSPVYTTGISSNDLISNIVITGTTFSNPSGTNNTGPYYTYFTGQPNYTASLQQGTTYDMVVSNGSFGNQNIAVWIDFNDNLTFEASEKVAYTTTSIASNSSATISLAIDCAAQVGLHKMRVRDVYATTGINIDPCISYGFGEVEDYDITIVAVTSPTGATTQSVSVSNPVDATIEDIVVTPATVTWYATEADALANVNPLAAGTQLVDNTIYYAVNIENGCASTPFAVTVAVVLGVNGFDNASFIAYPNPVNDVLNLSYSSEITSVRVINLLGQELISKNVSSNSAQIDMSNMSAGTYIVNVIIDDTIKTIKIIKK